MNGDWVISVIADLRRFAEENDLPALARELEIAEQVGSAEVAAAARTVAAAGGTIGDGGARGLSAASRTLGRA